MPRPLGYTISRDRIEPQPCKIYVQTDPNRWFSDSSKEPEYFSPFDPPSFKQEGRVPLLGCSLSGIPFIHLSMGTQFSQGDGCFFFDILFPFPERRRKSNPSFP